MHAPNPDPGRDGVAARPPAGRILCAQADHQPFVVLRHDRLGLFCIAQDGWDDRATVAGPFAPGDVLRAWRVANLRIPEGCERVSWQWGIGLLRMRPLPYPASEWSRFDPSWLSPSVSVYSSPDVDEVVTETCCVPPHDKPRVAWDTAPPLFDVDELRGLAALHSPGATNDTVGLLERDWNGHPVGSVVFTADVHSCTDLVVVDLPPPA
jgi:hypothetical protein